MRPLCDVSGLAAIVTGSSRGIGLAIARHFLGHGAQVVINGVNARETEAAVDGLALEMGRERVASFVGDVREPETAQTLISLAFERFGRLDCVVCNAAIDNIKAAVDYDVAEWDRMLAVNLRGAFLPAQRAARTWIDRGQRGSSIAFTSSIAARRPARSDAGDRMGAARHQGQCRRPGLRRERHGWCRHSRGP